MQAGSGLRNSAVRPAGSIVKQSSNSSSSIAVSDFHTGDGCVKSQFAVDQTLDVGAELPAPDF